MSIFNFFSNKKAPTINQELQKEQIRRQVDILLDCLCLIKDSKSAEVVLNRYDLVIRTLDNLSKYTDADLCNVGYKLEQPFSEIRLKLITSKNTYINQAIQRNFDDKIKNLKTLTGKLNAIDKLSKNLYNLPFSEYNKSYITEYLLTLKTELAETSQSITKTNGFDKITTSVDSNGSYCTNLQYSDDSENENFYLLSQQIDSPTDIESRLAACEKSYNLLPAFVKNCIDLDDDLPPLINCRDFGPEQYMRLGEWSKAERAIKACIAANAYYPEDGSTELAELASYRTVAESAIAYISQNPGCLQKNIYKALPFEGNEKENLKHFLRCSYQIEKVKFSSTNKLYYKKITKSE